MKFVGRMVLIGLMAVTPAWGQDGGETAARILVTFADPGMSNAARPGPARPGYGRRTSNYLVSVDVERAARRIADEFGLRIVDEWPIVPLKVHCLVYAVPDNEQVDQLLERLRSQPAVESAQRLNQFEMSSSDGGDIDPYARLQYNFETLGLIRAHAWSTGEGVKVTIIDTGADYDHPDLRSRIRVHRDFVDDAEERFTADAHGTAVAGVIGAAANNGVGMTGVAPAAELTVLKACWYRQTGGGAVCDSFTLAKALANALDGDPDIINLSLGGPSDPLLGRLVSLALRRNIAVVAAAPAGAGFPSDVAGVIVVGPGPQTAVGGAGHGQQVQAPGDDILVPVPGGGYDYASGSSLSAAQVSGIVALLLAGQPGLTTARIDELLIGSRQDSGTYVNACRALAALLGRSGCSDTGERRQRDWTLEAGGQTRDEL